MSHYLKPLVPLFALGALALLGVHTASATIRRPAGAYLFGPEVIWTNGTQSVTFQPLSEPLPSINLEYARIYLEVTEATNGTNLYSRPALRYGSDGVTWDPAQPIDTSWVTGSGTQPGTTFVDLTTLSGVSPKQWVQFGVQVKNNAGSLYEFAHMALLVEPKMQ